MNQKKAKALRRLCKGIARMKHNKNGDAFPQTVKHYRTAKKFFKGDLTQAVKLAEHHAVTMEAIGVYKFA